MTVEEGGKRWVKLKESGGRERREGIVKGLEGRVSVFRFLKGAGVTCGCVGSGGKAIVFKISNGVGGGSELEVFKSNRNVEIEERVRRLPYLWRAHLRALSRASPLNGPKSLLRSFWILT